MFNLFFFSFEKKNGFPDFIILPAAAKNSVVFCLLIIRIQLPKFAYALILFIDSSFFSIANGQKLHFIHYESKSFKYGACLSSGQNLYPSLRAGNNCITFTWAKVCCIQSREKCFPPTERLPHRTNLRMHEMALKMAVILVPFSLCVCDHSTKKMTNNDSNSVNQPKYER